MSNKFNERTGPFGNKYWEDENGKKIYERTGPFGNKYWEDENGNQINERTGPFGNKYYEDSDGKQTHERTGPFGNKYYEDSDGNQTNERTGPFGGNYLEQDAGAGFVPGSEKVEQTSRSRSSAGSGITESLSGLGWGTTVVLGLIALALFVVIGIPVLGGLLLIKLVNGILIPKTKNKRLWRWISFPVLFILGFMLTSELVAMGMWGFSCMSPNSSSCAAYIHQPYPTILGWHENIVRSRANNNSGNSVRQQSNTNNSNRPNSSQITSTIFDNDSFPKATCGDLLPKNIQDFPVNFYPVFVAPTTETLQYAKNNLCRDAYSMTRKDIGQRAVQVASFNSYERAEQFSQFLQKKVGSGEVGQPSRIEKPHR